MPYVTPMGLALGEIAMPPALRIIIFFIYMNYFNQNPINKISILFSNEIARYFIAFAICTDSVGIGQASVIDKITIKWPTSGITNGGITCAPAK